MINSAQCYKDTSYLQRVYRPPAGHKIRAVTPSPVTDLSARTFAAWNIAVGATRLFAAYHLSEPSWYHMSMMTNVIGLFHFGTEAFVFRTCVVTGPWLAPVSVAMIGLVWHAVQYSNYIH